jgi:protein-S-isoprenylcysteine O-methyltransferase Ste14
MMSLVARSVAVLVSSALFCVVAVIAGGGFARFFGHAPLIGLVVILAVVSVAAIFAGGNLSPGVTEDRGNRWVLAAFAILGVLLTVLPPWTDQHDRWVIDGDTIRWIGVILFALGGALRLWPVHVLGNRFSGLVAIQQGHALVTDGIYSLVRNPSYLGLLVGSLGWSLAFRSVAGVVLTLLHLPPLIARMSAEERLLQATFGAEYQAYRARTWRLVPYLY